MNISKKLVNHLEANCKADRLGNLICNKCGSVVSVDYSDMSASCSGCDSL